MTDRIAPRLSKWPFFLADAVLLGAAWGIFWQAKAPLAPWDAFYCAGCVGLGALLAVTPFLIEYRAAVRLSEADRLANAVLQIENLEILGRQITQATAGWQTAHEMANQSIGAAREISQGITAEARAFGEFLKKANDSEKNHLRLEVEKLRRMEGDWVQILVRILDHTFALYQAAVRSGQAGLVEQLGQFQNACRDVARRVGLVPFVAIAGELYDPKVHQATDIASLPAGQAEVVETIATGYSFQGQLVRPVLVKVRNRQGAASAREADAASESAPGATPDQTAPAAGSPDGETAFASPSAEGAAG